MLIRDALRADCPRLGVANRQRFFASGRPAPGRELVRRVADWLGGDRDRTLAVRVLAPNPNRAFYERLGAMQLAVQPYDWAGFSTHEVVYGWPDVANLCRRGGSR